MSEKWSDIICVKQCKILPREEIFFYVSGKLTQKSYIYKLVTFSCIVFVTVSYWIWEGCYKGNDNKKGKTGKQWTKLLPTSEHDVTIYSQKYQIEP